MTKTILALLVFIWFYLYVEERRTNQYNVDDLQEITEELSVYQKEIDSLQRLVIAIRIKKALETPPKAQKRQFLAEKKRTIPIDTLVIKNDTL